MINSQNGKGILLEVGTNEVEFLVFQITTQSYGINVAKISQIIIFDPTKVVSVPYQPNGVLGVFDHRGETISIVDLKTNLCIPGESINIKTHQLLLITEFNKRKTAFLVDAVDRIERCSWELFHPIEESMGNTSDSSVVGTVTLKDTIMILLDVESIMGKIDPSMSIEHYQNKINTKVSGSRAEVSIVYCEDSPLLRKILRQTLEKVGFKNFHIFPTGVEGLEYIKSQPPGSIDLIVSDIEMPQMDGLSLCKHVRALEHDKTTPFLFFSSMINEQMAAKCKAVGGNAYFSKPEIHKLVAEIDKLLNLIPHNV